MKNQTLVAGIVGGLIGMLLYPLLFGMGSWGGMMMWGNRYGNNMMGNYLTADISQHFIEQMIPHHEDAIAMAEIALTKAEHAEIKQLAANIKQSQSAENEQMRAWYKSWYGSDVPDTGLFSVNMGGRGEMMMHGGMMGDATDLTRLENAKPFDKEFIEQMIPHHQMAIMMATIVQRGSSRPEIIQLAKDIISAQTKEINDMRSWYTARY